MSALWARWRFTVAASMKPPGVIFTPLKRIVAGPFSSAPASPAEEGLLAFTRALLASMLAIVVLSAEVADFTSAVELATSVALLLASAAREFAAAAASRASSI